MLPPLSSPARRSQLLTLVLAAVIFNNVTWCCNTYRCRRKHAQCHKEKRPQKQQDGHLGAQQVAAFRLPQYTCVDASATLSKTSLSQCEQPDLGCQGVCTNETAVLRPKGNATPLSTVLGCANCTASSCGTSLRAGSCGHKAPPPIVHGGTLAETPHPPETPQ